MFVCLTDSSRACGGILTEPSGMITLDDSDDIFLDCQWLIVAEKGNFIQLNFTLSDGQNNYCCNSVSVS